MAIHPEDTSDSPPDRALESVSQRLVEGISTHAIFKLDAQGCIDSWSQSAGSLYGYDADDIIGSHIDVLFSDTNDTNPDHEALLARARNDSEEFEHWNNRSDGSVFWASLTISPLDENGDFAGYAVISQDTTEKKQYEQMLERQNDRLKEFTDIIAHDLRNPLNVIGGRLDLYRETQDDEHIEHIEETADRMERLVDDLLRISRQGAVVTDPQRTDLEAVINVAWEGTGKSSGTATLQYETVPPVPGDHDRLCEMFENLFRNAVEHAGPDVTVRVGPLDSGFYIEDDGPGIPVANRNEVFDHGFTTVDNGSGYGLSVIRTIVNAHGWDVRATESASGGARIEITNVEFID